MSDLLTRPHRAATMRSTAARLAHAAADASLSPDDAMPAQISRRELLQSPAAAPDQADVALREPEPDPELQRLARYIAEKDLTFRSTPRASDQELAASAAMLRTALASVGGMRR